MSIRSRYNELSELSLYQSLFTSANLVLRLLLIALASIPLASTNGLLATKHPHEYLPHL